MKRAKKGNRNIKIVIILIVVIALIAVIFAKTGIFPKKQEDKSSISGVVRPRLSFSYEGYEINVLSAYQEEMNIPLMRDVITPVKGGNLRVNIRDSGDVSKIVYELYSLDGKECLLKGEADPEIPVLRIEPGLIADEKTLVITVDINFSEKETESCRFYTRVVACDESSPLPAMEFIERFHQGALEKREEGLIGGTIEPDGRGGGENLQHVNIRSGYNEVTWGDMKPEKRGQVAWNIKEMNGISVSVQLDYEVLCHKGEEEEGVYDVEEFFRVRHIRDGEITYLLDYERHIFQNMEAPKVSEAGIELGMNGDHEEFRSLGKTQETVFVTGKEVWIYRGRENELVKVFQGKDFGKIETVKIISQDEGGNLAFAVYGHKDQGEQKNRSGVFIFEYSTQDNVTKEVMAIISKKSPEIFSREFGELMYYNVGDRILRFLYHGEIHELNADTGEDQVTAEGMDDTGYIVSPSGKRVAFSVLVEENGLSGLQIMDFETGESRIIKSVPGESVRPLGFINEDVICGVYRDEDKGKSSTGEELSPMYKVEIIDETQIVRKSYSQDGVFVVAARVEGNVITLERVEKEENIYEPTDDDYITSNEKEDQGVHMMENVATEAGRTIKVISGAEPINVARLTRKEASLPQEKSIVTVADFKEQAEGRYYAYGYGKLRGIFDNPGEAITAADEFHGVVVAENQHYVWERGNRDLVFALEGKEGEIRGIVENLKGGLSPGEAIEQATGKKAEDFSKCTSEQLCYIINCGIPVAVRMGTGEGIVLVGYNEETLRCVTDGEEEKTISYEVMDQWGKDAGISIAAYL